MAAIHVDLEKTAKQLLILLILIQCGLVFMDFFTVRFRHFLPLQPLSILFDLGLEANIPTWFSGIQFFICAILSWLIYQAGVSDHKQTRSRQAGWLPASLLFVYLSMDDMGHIHEKIGKIFERIHRYGLHDSRLLDLIGQYPSYPWQIVFGPVLAVCGGLLFFFLMKNLAETRLKIIAFLAFSCYGTAVLLDFFDGFRAGPFLRETDFFGHTDRFSHLLIAIEETLEMTGTTLLIYAFFIHLARVAGGAKLMIKKPRHD